MAKKKRSRKFSKQPEVKNADIKREEPQTVSPEKMTKFADSVSPERIVTNNDVELDVVENNKFRPKDAPPLDECVAEYETSTHHIFKKKDHTKVVIAKASL